MEALDFAISFNTGLVTLKRDILNSNNSSPVSLKLFESSKIVNTIPLTLFHEIIKKAIGNSYSSPMLPYGTVFFQETESYFLLALKVKEFSFSFDHSSMEKLKGCTAIFPDSYFLFVIPSSALITPNKKISISKTYILVDNSPLDYFSLDKKYKLSAYPNFSEGYNSGICWGGGDSSQYLWSRDIVDIRSLETAPHKYVNSRFNNDLSPKIKTSVLFEELKTFFEGEGLFAKYCKFLTDKRMISKSYSSFDEFKKNIDYHSLHYSFICWYSEEYKKFPPQILAALQSYDQDVSKIIQSPLRG